MKKNKGIVYIIFGASGSGKTTLLHEIASTDINYSIHTKGTNRKERQYDGEEIKNVGEDFSNFDYQYSRYGYIYGIQKSQISDAIEFGTNHFIVCNDIDTITDIKSDFKDRVRVIFFSFDAPRKIIVEIQKSRKISDDEINLRIQKIDALNSEFLSNKNIFDHVIINKFGSPPSYMVQQLRRIIESEGDLSAFNFKEIKEELISINNKISDLDTTLKSQSQFIESFSEKGYVFIIMAMIEEDPNLVDVLNAFKRSCKEQGLRAERVDEMAHSVEITDKILGSIRNAEYIITDLTHNRPNVYYELGYAHAFEKKVILTAKHGTLLHFDIRNYPVIYYKSITSLEDQLRSYLIKYEDQK